MHIGIDILHLYDKYDQDFGLLSERWASPEDRNIATADQMRTFCEYIECLNTLIRPTPSISLKEKAEIRISEIEMIMDSEVSTTLRHRVFTNWHG